MNIEKAREMLAAATAEPPVCACSNPEIVHEEECRWLRWNYEMPPAMGQLTGQAPAAFAALILAVEALEAEKEARLATGWRSTCDKQVHGDSHIQCGECFICLERKALAAWEKL